MYLYRIVSICECTYSFVCFFSFFFFLFHFVCLSVYTPVYRLPCRTARKASTSSTARQLQCSRETGCQRVGSVAIELWSDVNANYWCGTILKNGPPLPLHLTHISSKSIKFSALISCFAGREKSIAHIEHMVEIGM